MILVNHQAPNFTAAAVLDNGEIIENFILQDYIQKKEAVIFFWPMDFTFICPSELIACNKRYNEFQKKDVKIVGISIDSVFVHKAWRNLPIEKGGIGTLKYPMISDIKRDIMKKYGIEHKNKGVALRASFLVDKLGIVRHQVINDLAFGRNFDEMLRMIDALQFHEANNGLLCPAQWNKTQQGLKPSQDAVTEFLSNNYTQL